MMRFFTTATLATAALLTACNSGGGSGNESTAAASAERQPGSWSQKVELLRLEGADVQPGSKEQMQQMFNMMSGMSVCLTPEAAAEESMTKNLEQMGGAGNTCTFDTKELNGSSVNFSGTCKGQDGGTVRIKTSGTSNATAQDLTMTIEPLSADGTPDGVMEMRMTGKRNGDCTEADITPPQPGAAAEKAPAPGK